jgi:hypothetical protein
MATLDSKILGGGYGRTGLKTPTAQVMFDMSDMREALNQYTRETGKSSSEVLSFAARIWLEQARRHTPVAKKTTQTPRDESGHILAYLKTAVPVRGRGYARQVFHEIGRKAKIHTTGETYWRGGQAPKVATGVKRLTGDQQYIVLGHAARHIEALDTKHNIEQGATNNATIKLVQMMTRAAEREARRISG